MDPRLLYSVRWAPGGHAHELIVGASFHQSSVGQHENLVLRWWSVEHPTWTGATSCQHTKGTRIRPACRKKSPYLLGLVEHRQPIMIIPTSELSPIWVYSQP